MRKKEIKWLDFFIGANTVMVTNETEFNKFVKFLDDLGVNCLLGDDRKFSDWQHLSIINNYDPNCILFEFQPGKGMTFGSTIEESINWCGDKPLTVEVFDLFYKNSKLVEKNKEVNLDLEEEIER